MLEQKKAADCKQQDNINVVVLTSMVILMIVCILLQMLNDRKYFGEVSYICMLIYGTLCLLFLGLCYQIIKKI